MWASIVETLKWILQIIATRRENRLADAKKKYAEWRAGADLKKADRKRRADLAESSALLVRKENKL